MNLEKLTAFINLISETIWFFRQQYFYQAQGRLKKFMGQLQELVSVFPALGSEENISAMGLPMIIEAQTSRDEILIADILEGQMLPFFQMLVQELQQGMDISEINHLSLNVENIQDTKLAMLIKAATPRKNCGYFAEFTASGNITIRLQEHNRSFYICGNNNPYRDALDFYSGNVLQDKYRYVLFGAGLFYDAEVMLEQRPDMELVIVEEDPYLLKMAITYRDVSGVLSDERIKLVCCDYMEYIRRYFDEDKELVIRKPAIYHLENDSKCAALERFFVKTMTIKEQKGLLERNFRMNIQDKCVQSVDSCKNDFCGKQVYLVAGGPSLDKSLDILRQRATDSRVICVGTSARKLMKAGIAPEYVIITDGLDAIYSQIAGVLDETKTRLFYMCSANAKAVDSFGGKKYAMFQKGFDMAERYANEQGYPLVLTGGSVSTTALDVCIQLGCENVICLGLDLAYSGNRTHASDTLDNVMIAEETITQQVKSVSGGMIGTAANLAGYHKWIENRIKDVKGIRFINISDGAYIHGMENVGIEEVK